MLYYVTLWYQIMLYDTIYYTISYDIILWEIEHWILAWCIRCNVIWGSSCFIPFGVGPESGTATKKKQSGTSFWRSKGATFVTSQEHFNHSYGVWCTHRFLYTQHQNVGKPIKHERTGKKKHQNMDRKKRIKKKPPKIWEGMDPFQCPVWLISILETCVDGAASLRLKAPLIWQVPNMACRSGDLKRKGILKIRKCLQNVRIWYKSIQIHTWYYYYILKNRYAAALW